MKGKSSEVFEILKKKNLDFHILVVLILFYGTILINHNMKKTKMLLE